MAQTNWIKKKWEWTQHYKIYKKVAFPEKDITFESMMIYKYNIQITSKYYKGIYILGKNNF